MTITLAFGSGNGNFLSHLGNRIYHFIGSNSLVVYHQTYYHALFVQWNLVIKRSDITKPSYNKENLLVPALNISFFDPDMRNLI